MKIIVFEGIDASGKETQSKILQSRLESQGYKVHKVSFPRYSMPIGKLIQDVLLNKHVISKEALHILFEVDRLDFQKELTNIHCDFLIIDRYTISNLAYCLANDIEIDWIKNIQSKLIKPDIVFYLDIPAETSFIRKSEREDSFERDFKLLKRVEQAYKFLYEELNCSDKEDYIIYRINGTLSPIEIHEEIMGYIKLFYSWR